MVEKSNISINVEGGFLFCGGWNFSKLVSVGSTFIREMRVANYYRESLSINSIKLENKLLLNQKIDKIVNSTKVCSF